MRTLAIDLGERRVGLALSDQGGSLATPLEVVPVRSADGAIQRILEIIQSQDVRRLVVGLPLNMDDTLGPAARAAVKWGQNLAAKTNLPVIFIDERLSSFEAEQSLANQKRAGRKLTRKKKKQTLDAVVAADFLQAFLDGRLSAIHIAADKS
jgi:putative Holliday junction resolvase